MILFCYTSELGPPEDFKSGIEVIIILLYILYILYTISLQKCAYMIKGLSRDTFPFLLQSNLSISPYTVAVRIQHAPKQCVPVSLSTVTVVSHLFVYSTILTRL